jgi:hypothetical protein
MLSFNISYPDLIKFPYFANNTERGVWWWKEAQRRGEFNDFSFVSQNFSKFWPPIIQGSHIFEWPIFQKTKNYNLVGYGT